MCTHFVVGEEAPGAAVGAGSSRAGGSGSHSGVCGVGQGEGPSVRRQAHQRLGPHRAAVDPVLGHFRLGRESQQSVGSTQVTPRLLYHWWELPLVSFLSRKRFVTTNTCLSRQNTSYCVCCVKHVFVATKKHSFVATKDVFCRDKHVSVSKKKKKKKKKKKRFACRDKSFVATNVLSRQAYFCRDKRRVATRGSPRRRYFCHLPPHSARTGYANAGTLTPYLRASVQPCCQRPPKGLGSNNYDCGSNISSKQVSWFVLAVRREAGK